jgi:hypothetical protein
MKMLPVWYNGVRYESIMILAEMIGVNYNTLHAAIKKGEFRGKRLSYYKPRSEKKETLHIKGEPLIPHGVTSLISSDYRG